MCFESFKFSEHIASTVKITGELQKSFHKIVFS